MAHGEITPEYVLGLEAPTETFLCAMSANVYGIDFKSFKVRAIDEGSERILFHVETGANSAEDEEYEEPTDEDRFIQYHFGPEFLELMNIGTTLEFSIGETPLHNFRMIERHYFRNQLLASYDFELPFVIPGTVNTWEMIYTKPELTEEWKAALISAPWETRSDSFYFVQGRLVMHNRAEYSFAPLDVDC
eukprot:TRINITY_DN38427_c0_g1_i1.p2 TRINITY_DN38427_c0_g1~~TRINITY_DN38427_c0_g1_i1.p2  ORF type:complete len:190 (+),score=39.51 TRINITY_DN38427_c0_g1_i1:141-710(+)